MSSWQVLKRIRAWCVRVRNTDSAMGGVCRISILRPGYSISALHSVWWTSPGGPRRVARLDCCNGRTIFPISSGQRFVRPYYFPVPETFYAQSQAHIMSNDNSTVPPFRGEELSGPRSAFLQFGTTDDARTTLRMLNGRAEPGGETLHLELSRPPAVHPNQM
jgi:hypothetical protein